MRINVLAACLILAPGVALAQFPGCPAVGALPPDMTLLSGGIDPTTGGYTPTANNGGTTYDPNAVPAGGTTPVAGALPTPPIPPTPAAFVAPIASQSATVPLGFGNDIGGLNPNNIPLTSPVTPTSTQADQVPLFPLTNPVQVAQPPPEPPPSNPFPPAQFPSTPFMPIPQTGPMPPLPDTMQTSP